MAAWEEAAQRYTQAIRTARPYKRAASPILGDVHTHRPFVACAVRETGLLSTWGCSATVPTFIRISHPRFGAASLLALVMVTLVSECSRRGRKESFVCNFRRL
jgi:hypothetical protein